MKKLNVGETDGTADLFLRRTLSDGIGMADLIKLGVAIYEMFLL